METTKADRVLRWITAVLILWLFAASLISVVFGPIDRNAGFYIPVTELVRQGYVPTVDFWCPYTPGSFYLFSLLGEQGLRSPFVCKLVTHVVLLAYVLTMYCTLLTLGHRSSMAAFFACAMGVWIYSIGSWAIFSIDVIESWLVLVSFLCLCRWPSRRGAALAGLTAGCALMVKQYAILSIPWLALFAYLDARPDDVTNSVAMSRRNWVRPVLFLALVGVPYLVFVLYVRVNVIDEAVYFATWGGQAQNHGWGHGIEAIVKSFTGVSSYSMVVSAAMLMLALLIQQRTAFRIMLAGLFLAGATPLFVREFAGYIIHTAPWAIIVCATFANEFSIYFSNRRLASVTLALVSCLPLVQVAAMGSALQARTAATNPVARQVRLATALKQAVPASDKVLVINKWWLYHLTGFVPPLRDYNQLDVPVLQAMEPARDAAEFIVHAHDDKAAMPHQAIVEWIEQSHEFKIYKVLSVSGDEVTIYARARREDVPAPSPRKPAERAEAAAQPS